MPSPAFFTLHRDLPREGPGSPEDVHWTLEIAKTPEDARICDAACGPGADLVTLAEARPMAKIHGVDLTAHFVEEARRRCEGFGARVSVELGDYAELSGKFDLIWCAGAAYFKGFQTLLPIWKDHLAPGGAIAFSEPAYVSDPPAEGAVAFWDGEGTIYQKRDLEAQLAAIGWRVEAHRWVAGKAWANYYDPQEKRLDLLKSGDVTSELGTVIDEAEREIALWRANPDDIAYILFVVRPS